MHEQAQYAAASHVPLIKSPSLRIPKPIQAPPDIYPLPEDINAYFVYPFTLEPHVLALEASRRSTLAAHAAKHEAILKAKEERRVRAQAEALRRIAPGFEPQAGPLMPDKVQSRLSGSAGEEEMRATGHERQRSVMDDLVDHLAALDSASANAGTEGGKGGDGLGG